MESHKLSSRNMACVFTIGVAINLHYKIALFASQDVLGGTAIPTAAVLLALTLPDVLVRILTPWAVRRVPLLVPVGFGLVSAIVVVSVLSFTNAVAVRLAALVLLGAIASLNLIWCITLVGGFYCFEEAVTAYSHGKNASFLGGVLLYTVLTTWACVSPQIVMATSVIFLLLGGIAYAALDKTKIAPETFQAKGTAITSAKYQPLPTHDTDESEATGEEEFVHENKKLEGINWPAFAQEVLPFAVCMFFNGVSTAVTQFAVLPTLIFSATKQPRDAFLYYLIVFNAARCMGSYKLTTPTLFLQWILDFIQWRSLWVIITVLDCSMAVLFLFNSWFTFLPSLPVALVLLFVHGLLNGSLSVNMVSTIDTSVTNNNTTKVQNRAIQICQFGFYAGLIVAVIAGMFLEKELVAHCTKGSSAIEACLTRSQSANSWSHNIHCQAP